MVVDDENFSHTIIKNFLTRIKVEVPEIAENRLDAFFKYKDSILKNNPIHIVTIDINIPVTNEKEAAEKIRAFEVEKGIEPCLLIMISGNCSEFEIAECLNVNEKIRANTFLKKPTSIDELSKVISHHFG